MDQEMERIRNLIEKIISANTLVIVEGKKDRAALQKLGVNNIMELNKKPLFQIVEDIANSNEECIILTDLDKKGRELFGKLSSDLQERGLRVNNEFRDFLFRHTRLSQIEGVTTYLGAF